MRNGLTTDQFERWAEAYATGQLDDSWQQAAMVACEIRNLPVRLCGWFFGRKLKIEDLEMPDSFMPQPSKKPPAKKNSVEDFAAKMAGRFGG